VCFDPGDGKPLYVTDHDASSPLAACYPLHDVVDFGRIAYFAGRLVKILEGAKIPPPPP